jgi:hypothetical protein
MYDVLDQVHVNAVIKTYPDVPGTLPAVEDVVFATEPSRGTDDTLRWLLEGLSALQAEAASQ